MNRFKIIALVILVTGFFSCSKECIDGVGDLQVQCMSNNPYKVFRSSVYLGTVQGNSTRTFEVSKGTANFSFEQESGFAFYPTTGSATIEIDCEDPFPWSIP